MNRILTTLILIIASLHAMAARHSYSINESWKFYQGEHSGAQQSEFDDSTWEFISIPHTWNDQDALDDTPGFYRGDGWYRRNIYIGPEAGEKQVYIYFEGSNQLTELWVNGNYVGEHIGGYTRFSFDITEFVNPDSFNQFAIRVNNSHNVDIPPLSADFTFFGGIYRDVLLTFTEKVHISVTDYASSGVYITTPAASPEKADIQIRTILENKTDGARHVKLQQTIISPTGEEVARKITSMNLRTGRHEHTEKKLTINNPVLWDTENPALYSVYTRVYDHSSNQLLDEIFNPLGIRWFEFHPDKGFFLNGKHTKLIGTNRHQCYLDQGNALNDQMHVRDIRLLKEMGGNFLRVSHYPQDPVIMEMCDRLGIITSVEIPVVNAITQSETFTQNSIEMAREMIRQDFNRPSVMIWAYMNEVMLRLPMERDTEEYYTYAESVAEFGRQLEKTIRQEDPSRYTMLAFHGNLDVYEDARLVELPMLVGWNLYQGWYGGQFSGFNDFIDNFHQKYPNIPMLISEYGADADPRLHSFESERFDFTGEYATLYHEHYLRAIMDRTFVAGANIWNLNDFHSEYRGDSMPHINNKGITTLDRKPKNSYLLYRAALRKDPVLMIGSKDWQVRGGIADENGRTFQPLKIYTNLDSVEVKVNSTSIGKKAVESHIAQFDIPFVDGMNTVEASAEHDGRIIRDIYHVDFRQVPANLRSTNHPFTELNVMLGSKRYYEDKLSASIWLPEQPYSEGSWGYTGGKPYQPRTRFGVLPASDVNIHGSSHDPLFQTQRIGLESFRADVPNGRYAIYMYWAELDSGFEHQTLAYNLGQDKMATEAAKRSFDVLINNKVVLGNFDIAGQIGAERAMIKKFEVNVQNHQGITISFNAHEGQPVLNAVRIYRMY